jgi:hypothetical protein
VSTTARKNVWTYLLPVAVLVVLIAAGEIPAVWIDARRAGLLVAALSVTTVGLALMVWGWAAVAVRFGRPMSDGEAQAFASRPLPLPGRQSFRAGIFRGVARGRTTDEPPAVKLLIGGALVYAVVRTVSSLRRA